MKKIQTFFKAFSLSDWFINNWLLLYNRYLRYIKGVKFGKYEVPSRVTTYSDDFRDMDIEEFNSRWIRNQHWGNYHPGDLQQWYDPKAVEIVTGGLILKVTGNSHPDKSLGISNGVGLVTSKMEFSYGKYRWVLKLPKGRQLWPAIWLSGSKTWPPEIDVFEGYSNDLAEWGKHINTNIHCGDTPENHFGLGAFRGGFLINPDSEVIMDLHWTEDFIKIYYNGFLVRVVTSKRHLGWFNKNPEMWVIMNTALRAKATGKIEDYTISPFVVKSFRWWSES